LPVKGKGRPAATTIHGALGIVEALWRCEGQKMSGNRERQANLYHQHPDESPELIGVLPYLIHPPSKLGATAAWVSFRDRTLRPMHRLRPEDPNLPNFLKQVAVVLAWRSAVMPEDRFWKAD
jgi:hypothetical protein